MLWEAVILSVARRLRRRAGSRTLTDDIKERTGVQNAERLAVDAIANVRRTGHGTWRKQYYNYRLKCRPTHCCGMKLNIIVSAVFRNVFPIWFSLNLLLTKFFIQFLLRAESYHFCLYLHLSINETFWVIHFLVPSSN